MDDDPHLDHSIEEIAGRLAILLMSGGGELRDPSGTDLVFEPAMSIRPLRRLVAPPDVWAVDGGQALVADARCLQVYVTRAARVRWRHGRADVEDEGVLRAHLLGLGEQRHALASLGSPVASDAPVDVNLLRDWAEWSAVATTVAGCQPGAMVLVDGDLQPDWRVPSAWLARVLADAEARGVLVVGVTKHTSLAWGGSPLLAALERMAATTSGVGDRSCWWAPVARTRPDVGPGFLVTVARLDPDAPFSFRVDLPGWADPELVLGSLSALCDDAAFPGYPYPLSCADRLAACPAWVRQDVWDQIDEVFDRAGVPLDVRERAFADRHRLMERA